MSLKSFSNRLGVLALGAALFFSVAFLLQGCSEEAKNRSLIVVGSPAPEFTIELFDGKTWSLKAHNGKPVVVAFMASWCPCSNESVPFIKEAYQRYNPQGVEFLLIGIQDSPANFKAFLAERAVEIPAGYDSGDRVAALYGVDAPPVTVFMDREHKIRRVYFGNIKEVGDEYFRWVEEVR